MAVTMNQINRIPSKAILPGIGGRKVGETAGLPFQGQAFREILSKTLVQKGIHVSGHAEKRIGERKISLDADTKNLLNEAIDELSAKGAKDSLVITRDAAFILNVPSRTLITAMNLSEAKNRLVTQIDSVLLKDNL